VPISLPLTFSPLQPTDFPNPTAVDPTRPRASYNLNGTGFHGCPGVTYAEQTIAEIVKVVFGLKNVRRAPGTAGQLVGYTTVINETETNVYVHPNGSTSPWPGSMHLVVRCCLFFVAFVSGKRLTVGVYSMMRS
jgi:linoleate 10R-lipoxygenase